MVAFQQGLWALTQDGNQSVAFVDRNLLGTTHHLAVVPGSLQDQERIMRLVVRGQ
jgi:hypothetical protein